VKLLAVACAGVLVASCLVDRRTNDFECEVTAECTGGRVCDGGFCVLAEEPACSEDCNGGCDPINMTCTIICSAPGQCGSVECPFGFECTINCNSPSACGSIDCDRGDSCVITCSASGACSSIDCGDGRCDVTCANNGCGSIDCSDSCACDVACTGPACAMTCPSGDLAECTLDGTDDTECSSTTQAGCSTCGT
jgi:hypothetical protein